MFLEVIFIIGTFAFLAQVVLDHLITKRIREQMYYDKKKRIK
jgi:hypothetical protein